MKFEINEILNDGLKKKKAKRFIQNKTNWNLKKKKKKEWLLGSPSSFNIDYFIECYKTKFFWNLQKCQGLVELFDIVIKPENIIVLKFRNQII